jgi:BirA family biotin operon repressor/biotin-[acetyl-CoA-carboxylase] ligase
MSMSSGTSVPSPGLVCALTRGNLASVADDLRARLDHDALQAAAGPPWTVRLHDALGSTNAEAASTPERNLVVVADHQQAGRGRLDRVWVTPQGAALTFTAVLDPSIEDQWWPLLPLATGLAVARAAGAVLKWPNDVLIEGEKVCGILIERVQTGTGPLALLGVGINVTQSREELPVDTATSLLLADRPTDRTELFGEVLTGIRAYVDMLARSPHELMTSYRDSCSTLGQQVRVELPSGQSLVGEAMDLDAHGRLMVDAGIDTGVVPVAAGDVVHVRPAKANDQ